MDDPDKSSLRKFLIQRGFSVFRWNFSFAKIDFSQFLRAAVFYYSFPRQEFNRQGGIAVRKLNGRVWKLRYKIIL